MHQTPQVLIALSGGIYPDGDISPFATERTVIYGVDGGADELLKRGLYPSVVVGDNDSMTSRTRQELEQRKAAFHHFPVDKDFTDFELCLELVRRKFPNELSISVLGALGGDHDFSFGNVFALLHPALLSAQKRLIGRGEDGWVLATTQSVLLEGVPGDVVSIVPLSDCRVSTDSGLQWTLNSEILKRHQLRSLRNRMVSGKATVTVEAGEALVVHKRGVIP